MKRIIYTLTVIFSAVAAAIHIIEYIAAINQYYSGEFSFELYRFSQIAGVLALGVLSVVQLKKHTPRIMLVLCGYVFYEAALSIYSQYLFGSLLMAAALIPAIYEFSRYGMTVRQEPIQVEKRRWLLIAAFALALALSACRVALDIVQAVALRFEGFIFYPTDIVGISVLLCAVAFCAFMNRRTSMLYRMFFAGCVLIDVLPIASAQFGWLPSFFLSDTLRMYFIGLASLHALFVLLIFIHSFLTRRSGSLIPQEVPDITEQALNDAGISE